MFDHLPIGFLWRWRLCLRSASTTSCGWPCSASRRVPRYMQFHWGLRAAHAAAGGGLFQWCGATEKLSMLRWQHGWIPLQNGAKAKRNLIAVWGKGGKVALGLVLLLLFLTSLLAANAPAVPPCRMPRNESRLDHSRFWLSEESERKMCVEPPLLVVPPEVLMLQKRRKNTNHKRRNKLEKVYIKAVASLRRYWREIQRGWSWISRKLNDEKAQWEEGWLRRYWSRFLKEKVEKGLHWKSYKFKKIWRDTIWRFS